MLIETEGRSNRYFWLLLPSGYQALLMGKVLLQQTYLVFGGGGATHQVINDFRQVFDKNPCDAERP